jgi:ABC-type multidrug transport system ATPase subunit
MSLPEAFKYASSTRNRFVIVNRENHAHDVQSVINELTSVFQTGNKEVHVAHDVSALTSLCPSSSRGVSPCFGAVEFHSSPDQGDIWRYTLYQDGAIGQSIDVLSNTNAIQVYTLPLQHAIDAAISKTTSGPNLGTVVEYPFTIVTEAEKQQASTLFYEQLVTEVLGFAFFIGLCGVTYHLTGHITRQREQGMLQLIDAMMPNKKRWQCLIARGLASHLAFDIIYAPGWIVMGGVTSVLAFPATNPGWIILIYLLAGISLTGFSLLASSIFRRAQLSAISAVLVVVVMAIIAQFAEGNRKPANLIGVLVTAGLFTPNAFVYFLLNVAAFEQNGHPLAITQPTPNNVYWSVPAYVFLACIVLHIIVYPILGAIVERWLHSTSSHSRHLLSTNDMAGNAIRVRNFSKHYKIALRERDRVRAVKNLCLDIHAGSLTVLLGANGSGKSTTLSAISGLESISSGDIEVDGTGGIGLCPQKNVLWGDMTVNEHVYFFQRLKWPSLPIQQSRDEARRLVIGCDLEIKSDAKAKTLSGGQMRKLQLAMMLAGGSRVCCIDEASSGIDPLARRKIWDILLNERGDRTMLLTTHFLDESEVLADHVAILSKGQLKAEGSVASLKTNLGGGYRVILPKDDRIPRVVRENPDVLHRQDYNESVFEIPDAATLAPFVNSLEENGIGDYRVQGPTMEDVFLRLAEEMKNEANAEKMYSGVNYSRPVSARPTTGSTANSNPMPLKLHTGRRCGPIRQTAVLFLKRLTVLKHNFMPYVAALCKSLVHL